MEFRDAARRTLFLALVLGGVHGSLNAQPATKNIFPATGLSTPIGIAYSPSLNRLLVTEPFCGTIDTGTGKVTGFSVQQVSPTGSSSLFASLPEVALSSGFGHDGNPYNQCFEFYPAVSPGLGGFPANQVYVTLGQSIVTIPPGGGSSSTFVPSLATSDTENGITFDTVGSFCNDMIVSGSNGLIYVINSAGVATPYAVVSSTISTASVSAESVAVAPLSFGTYAGWLIVGIENTNGPGIAAIQPPSACSASGIPTVPNGGTPTQVRLTNLPGPEFVLPIPSLVNSCQFGSSPAKPGTVFSITYTGPVSFTPGGTNPYQIVSYPSSDFTTLVGDILVGNEGPSPSSAQTDYLTGASPGTPVLFDSGLGTPPFTQQEGATLVPGCPIGGGCVLTPGGYKNHFNYKVTPLIIGATSYTAAQVTQIVSTGGGGINALGRSLATALLNIQYGAGAPASVLTAVSQAQALIASVTTAVGKTIFQVSTAGSFGSSLNNILDAFNNGSAGQGECQQ